MARNSCHPYDSFNERRWAKCLEHIGIEVEHHPKIGLGYWIPDFYLPHYELYCEVKPYFAESYRHKLLRAQADGLHTALLTTPRLYPDFRDLQYWYTFDGKTQDIALDGWKVTHPEKGPNMIEVHQTREMTVLGVDANKAILLLDGPELFETWMNGVVA